MIKSSVAYLSKCTHSEHKFFCRNINITLVPKAEGLYIWFLQLSAVMTDFDFTEYFNKHCVLKRECKIVPVHALKGVWGSGDVTPIILNHSTRLT